MVELIVAVGLMGMIIAFSSIIFRFGIDAHRISSANAEIMQKTRAITEQLNSDLRGLRKDAPIVIWFYRPDPNNDSNLRADQFMFFADGEYSSMQSYSKFDGKPVAIDDLNQKNTKLVHGNLARIHYGHTEDANNRKTWTLDEPKRTLGRRCHIITDDNDLELWPRAKSFDISFPETTSGQYKNEVYEHDRMSLGQWKKLDRDDFEYVFDTAFFDRTSGDEERPVFDTTIPQTYHKLLCEGVGSFAVQWAYWDRRLGGVGDYELRWFPSRDPDGDGFDNDSQFDLNFQFPGDEKFGVFFNIPHGAKKGKWFAIEQTRYRFGTGRYFEAGFFPAALKFTFTVYDSRGIIEGGRTFTHIVYLED